MVSFGDVKLQVFAHYFVKNQNPKQTKLKSQTVSKSGLINVLNHFFKGSFLFYYGSFSDIAASRQIVEFSQVFYVLNFYNPD